MINTNKIGFGTSGFCCCYCLLLKWKPSLILLQIGLLLKFALFILLQCVPHILHL